jgi:selenium metabolism protein YedF
MLNKMKILEVIDCSGFSCPGPLIQTKTYYDTAKEGTSFKVIVDNEVSSLNVERFLKQNGCDYEVIKESETRYLLYSDVVKASLEVDKNEKKDITLLYYIASRSVGTGDCDLGNPMLFSLIANIKNLDRLPNTLIFINAGVRALAESEKMQEDVKELIELGVKVYYCGTCAVHFNVTNDIKVGTISNLHEIMTLLGEHDRIVRP